MYRPLIDTPFSSNGNYSRDPSIKALKSWGFINPGSTLGCVGHIRTHQGLWQRLEAQFGIRQQKPVFVQHLSQSGLSLAKRLLGGSMGTVCTRCKRVPTLGAYIWSPWFFRQIAPLFSEVAECACAIGKIAPPPSIYENNESLSRCRKSSARSLRLEKQKPKLFAGRKYVRCKLDTPRTWIPRSKTKFKSSGSKVLP